MNGDELPDLFSWNYGADSVSVILNTTAVEQIDVQGNSISIASGDTSPSSADNTDFGSALLGASLLKEFSISTSPANDNSPKVTGTSDAGTTVKLFTNASCA